MNIIDQLKLDEGVRYSAYRDSIGKWTIGVGHLILPSEQWMFTAVLSEQQVDDILQSDLESKVRGLAALPWYVTLDLVRQAAVCNMAFNIGVQGLLGFPHMIAALARGDWKTASDEALNSLWSHQVGARATRIARQFLTGQWQ